MGKFLGGVLVTVLVVVLLFYFGILGWGSGKGNGNGAADADTKQSQTIEKENKEITIVVTQDKYMMDEQEVTLTQIKEKVTDTSAEITVVLENNYASAKAWDEIKNNLQQWGIVPIEQ